MVYHLQKWRHYLLNKKFKLRTDHASLTYLMNFKSPQNQLARWLSVLSEYDYDLEYRRGTSHLNADACSRLPCGPCAYCTKRQILYNGIDDTQTKTDDQTDNKSVRRVRLVEAPEVKFIKNLEPEVLAGFQQCDPVLRTVIDWLESGERPCHDDMSGASPECKAYWNQYEQLTLKGPHNLLYKKWYSEVDNEVKYLLVAPLAVKDKILESCHDSMLSGHLGVFKTLERVRSRFYWYKMKQSIRDWIRFCIICNQRKPVAKKPKAKLKPQVAGQPGQLVFADLIGPLPESKEGFQYILCLIDHFTKWAEAYPLKSQTTLEVAHTMVTNYFCTFGCPFDLKTDLGKSFQSELFKNVCQLLGITQLRSTPYRPQAQGAVERCNRSIISMISSYANEYGTDWPEKLPFLMAAYRSSVHTSTGYTPAKLTLGKEITMPIDIMFPSYYCAEEQAKPIDEYADELGRTLNKAYHTVRENLKTVAERQSKAYDVRIHQKEYKIGDLVWRFNDRKRKKFEPAWLGPFIVIEKICDVIYRIQAGQKSNSVIIHHDKLRKCESNKVPQTLKYFQEKVVKLSQEGSVHQQLLTSKKNKRKSKKSRKEKIIFANTGESAVEKLHKRPPGARKSKIPSAFNDYYLSAY